MGTETPALPGDPSLHVRDYRHADAPAVRQLWDRVFGFTRGGQTVDWLFRKGPAGEPLRAVVEWEGQVVAHAGLALHRAHLLGEEVLGGYSVGAMTDARLRGRGLFVQVGRHLYARAEREGLAFVAGFSNRNSHRIMTGPLGRRPVRPFPWCVRPLRPLRARQPGLPRERGGVRIEYCEAGDPRLDILWRAAAPDVRLGLVRDAAFSAWRFGERPDAHYRILLAHSEDRPAACAVYRTLRIRGVRAGFVVDLLADPSPSRTVVGPLLRTLMQLARSEGALLLSALLPGRGQLRRSLQRCGFVRIPETLHPQVIRFSVRGLGRWRDVPELFDPCAWLITWADTDVV